MIPINTTSWHYSVSSVKTFTLVQNHPKIGRNTTDKKKAKNRIVCYCMMSGKTGLWKLSVYEAQKPCRCLVTILQRTRTNLKAVSQTHAMLIGWQKRGYQNEDSWSEIRLLECRHVALIGLNLTTFEIFWLRMFNW